MTTPPNAGEPVAQEGWVLVPKVATIGMIRALTGSWDETAKHQVVLWVLGSFDDDYAAMLAAAPQPSDPYPWLARGAIPPREPPRQG